MDCMKFMDSSSPCGPVSDEKLCSGSQEARPWQCFSTFETSLGIGDCRGPGDSRGILVAADAKQKRNGNRFKGAGHHICYDS